MDGIVTTMIIVMLVPVFIAMMFTPYFTRKTESFGVSIPEDIYHSETLQSMRKQYVTLTGVMSVLTIAIFFLVNLLASFEEQTFSIMIGVGTFLYLLITFAVYFRFHREMKNLKTKEGWGKDKPQQTIIHTGFRDQKLIYSNGWFIIPFAITIGMVLITFMFYDRIPERIPMQYNFSGEVTNWSEKSYRSVMALPVMTMYLTLLFIFLNTMIGKAKQQLNAENPEKSIKQSVIFRRRWSAFMIIMGIALAIMFALQQMSFIFPIHSSVMMIVPLLFGLGAIVAAIVLAFTTGQGGSRVRVGMDRKGEGIDRDDDKYWKLGQFYFNPSDPAIFVEKRFGVGWTINGASPLAWTIFLLIILSAVGISLLL